MNTYHVYLKRGPMAIVSADGYSEDKRAKRFYFHSDFAKKDRVTFFSSKDVVGIHAFELVKFDSQELVKNLAKLRKVAGSLSAETIESKANRHVFQ